MSLGTLSNGESGNSCRTKINAAIAAINNGPAFQGIIHKATNGVETSYATLAAAKAAVSSGTIFVGPGTYNETNLLKDGVDWYFAPGAIVDYTGAGGAIWDDSATGANGAVECKIQGYGRFIYTGDAGTPGISKNVFYVTNAGTHIDANCEEVFLRSEIDGVDTDSENGAVVVTAGYLKLNCHAIEATDAGACFFIRAGVIWRGGSIDLRCERIYVNSPSGTPYGWWTDGASSGDAWVYANHITSENYVAIGSSGATSGSKLYLKSFTAKTISGTSFATIQLEGGDTFLDIDLLSTTAAAFAQGSGSSTCWLNCREIVAGATSIATIGSGTVHILGGTLTGTGINDGVLVEGGTCNLDGVNIDTSAIAGADAVRVTGGTCNINNSTLAGHSGSKDIAQSGGTVTVSGGHGSGTANVFTTSGTVAIVIPGLITNAMLAGSIAYSKLTLTGAILDADLAGSIAPSKITGTAAILGANTFTALQTITQAAANAGILASTGYSLTGSDATGMINLAGTWNTTGNPVAFKLAITNTASGATSKFISLLAGAGGATEQFSVDKNGYVLSVGGRYSVGDTSNYIWNAGNNAVSVTAAGVAMTRFTASEIRTIGSFTFNGSNIADPADLLLVRDSAATLQLGADHATAATAQTIKGHDVTTGTGASLSLGGGKGSAAGGALNLATSVTNGALVSHLTIAANGDMVVGTSTSRGVGFYGVTPTAQQGATADASGGAIIDAEARAAINDLLAKVRVLGLIAT